ncbi:MAG: hypothetical protein KGN84_12120 [Acidobacteriota bacterium]|nr:hypothetical protein [Acidobacteriota bacterium]
MFEKTVSEAQLAANRENAQKSTGPKTEAGKAASSRNACRHNLTGQVVIMTDEDHDACVQYEKSFIADLKPEGALESALVHSIAHAFWRLNRAEAIEENYFSLEAGGKEDSLIAENGQILNAALHCLTFFKDPNKFVLLSLYEQRIHRKLEKDRKALRDLQAARLKAASHAPKARPSVEPKPETVAHAATCRENGFVFSNTLQPAAEPVAIPETAPESPETETGIPIAA